jgi:hypothetical protein
VTNTDVVIVVGQAGPSGLPGRRVRPHGGAGHPFDIDEVTRRWDANADLAEFGAPHLRYGLPDHIVDGHFEVLQALDDRIEELEPGMGYRLQP